MPRDWGDPTSVMQPREPAFWLLVSLIAIGVLRIGSMVGEAFRLYPTGSLLAITLLTLYAIPFFVFVYRLDLFEREPVTMVAAAFAWGGLAATWLALPGNQAIFGLASKLGSPDFAGRWGPALAAPPVEETLKILGVVLLVLIARDQFDSPLDGMVYGALVGLGFQVVEDFVYCINAITLSGGDGEIGPVLGTFVVRALVGLWSHATYTAIAGYGVGYVASRRDRKLADRLLVAAACFAVAYSAHFIWNSPLLTDAFGEGAGIVLGLVLKGIPVVVLLVVMYRLARRQEATWFRDAVASEVGTDVLLREELDELMTLSSRRDVIKMVRRVKGKRAAKLVGQLQHAQLELGLACSRRGATGDQDVEEARRTIRLLRVELAQQGVVRAGTLPGAAGGVAAAAGDTLAGGGPAAAGGSAGQAVGATGADSSPPAANP
jgi:RsiW-degrading membrane proteinase PrsW (M82 family)